MAAFFQFFADNDFILLFVVVGLAIALGRVKVAGYGLGEVASAIIVGCGFAAWASTYGVTFRMDEWAKSLFYYLFMYGVGLRVGPSFTNSLGGDGLKFLILAVVSCVTGLAIVVLGVRLFDLPFGSAGGLLAGSQTMSAAIGSAELAVTSGAVKPPPGTTAADASAMIALSYGISYIWGTVGIVLICKYLPKWWGVDAKAAARRYEEENGVKSLEAGVTGFRPFAARAYCLVNPDTIGMTVADFLQSYPMYRIGNVRRGDENLGHDGSIRLEKDDIVVLGGSLGALTDHMGIIGPECPDAAALAVPIDTGEILVTERSAIGKPLRAFADEPYAGQVQVTRIERAGQPIPVTPETVLQRRDVLFFAGLKSSVEDAGRAIGIVARHNSSTDLLTLSAGMVLGLLIGLIEFPAFGASVGLGAAGGLLVSGIIVSSLASRLRFFGNTPNAARNILEDMGLIVFVAIVGINAGATLLAQLDGALALKLFGVGFVACTVPPFVTWALGYHVFRLNPAVLMGGVAGARSHSGPCREAAVEIGSSVPWVGFPVGYAVAGVLLTVFGYFAMLLAGS